MELNKIQAFLKDQSDRNGWNKVDRRPLEWQACIGSEIGEMTDAVRDNLPPICYKLRDGEPVACKSALEIPQGMKPEGEAVELADVFVWGLVYAASRGWNMEELIMVKSNFNSTRGERHGGKLK